MPVIFVSSAQLRLNFPIGPEVVGQAVRVLETLNAASDEFELKLSSHDIGGCALDNTGDPLPESTLKACQEADAILLGAFRLHF